MNYTVPMAWETAIDRILSASHPVIGEGGIWAGFHEILLVIVLEGSIGCSTALAFDK